MDGALVKKFPTFMKLKDVENISEIGQVGPQMK